MEIYPGTVLLAKQTTPSIATTGNSLTEGQPYVVQYMDEKEFSIIDDEGDEVYFLVVEAHQAFTIA